MNYEDRASISYYKNIAEINSEHKVYLVQNINTGKFFVKKVLDVYNCKVYEQLKAKPVKGVPAIIEYCDDGSQLTLIEEYIPGSTLDELINREPVSIETTRDIALKLCDIVEQLQSFDPPIIHRDIKPTNISIDKYGNLTLLDFNAAKFLDPQKETDTTLLGTVGYAAPEQYGFGVSSVQTDIYAIGMLIKELLGIKTSHFKDHPLAPVINKCTMLRPEDRYLTIAELKDALSGKNNPDESIVEKKAYTFSDYLPPGFRSGNIFKMLIAIFGYIFVIYLFSGLNLQPDAAPFISVIDSFLIILDVFVVIFFTFNYLGMKDKLPYYSKLPIPLKVLATIVLDILIFSAILVLIALISTFLASRQS